MLRELRPACLSLMLTHSGWTPSATTHAAWTDLGPAA